MFECGSTIFLCHFQQTNPPIFQRSQGDKSGTLEQNEKARKAKEHKHTQINQPSTPYYSFPFLSFITNNNHFHLFKHSKQTPPTTTKSTPLQMCDHDDWVNLAMADDSTVAGLLLKLHHRPHPHLHWTVRQRRSTHKTTSTRASPTTPLSWSGGGNNIDSHEEESSHLTKHAGASRSDKVANPSETVTTKKARRKKTLAELKEEESLLLKERRNLKNELASLRITVDQQIATNESLKKMKLDLDLRQNSNTTTTSEVSGKVIYGRPSQFMEAECRPSNSVYPKIVTHEVLDHDSLVYAANASSKAQEIGNQESTFILPDLNLPVEEDFSINAMH